MIFKHLTPPGFVMKWFSVMALGLVLLASCDINDPQAGMLYSTNEIGLNAVSRIGTKGYVEGTMLVDTPYDQLHDGIAEEEREERTIRMSAYLYPQTGESREYFRNEPFDINANGESDNLWHHSPKIYWPLGGTLDFLAYSLTTSLPATALTWDRGNAAAGFSVRLDKRYTQDDFLVAAASGKTSTSDGATVPMTFSHTQAWLEFNVHAEENGIVTLDAIEIEDLFTEGRLDVKNVSGEARATWNFDAETAYDTKVDDIGGVFGTRIGTTVRHFDMLIPQQGQRSFVLKYHLSGIDMPLEYRYELPVAFWEMGKKYIYDITISPKEITVDPLVTEWNVVSEDWVYATATHIDAVGTTFTFSEHSLYYWRPEAPATSDGPSMGDWTRPRGDGIRTKAWNGSADGGYELLQYVSGEYGDRVKFKSADGNNVVMYSESIQRDVAIEVEENPLTTPLTFEFITDGDLYLKHFWDDPYGYECYITIEYSKNGGEWTAVTSTDDGVLVCSASSGDIVRFRGDNTNTGSMRSSWVVGTHNSFVTDAMYYAYGNVHSLVKSEGYDEPKTVTACGFGRLFMDNTGMRSHPEKELVIPVATSNGNACFMEMFKNCTGLVRAPKIVSTDISPFAYYKMFEGCTALTEAPELPLLTLAKNCYQEMFSGCTALVNAPQLPATTLKPYCYANMFSGCTSIVTAPVLQVPALVEGCFQGMFDGCSSLRNVPDLPWTALAPYCYAAMFKGCSSLTQVPALPAAVMKTGCYKSMFEGCTSLVNAPALSSQSIAESCYSSMFAACTSLVDAPALPATVMAPQCYRGMFSGCTNLVNVPVLNSVDLAPFCYGEMFSGCSSLVNAPVLPASIMKVNCYLGMFKNCVSLVDAPALNSTDLASGCYYEMFSGCTSLVNAPALPAMTLPAIENYAGYSVGCYYKMFLGCSSLEIAPVLPAPSADYCWMFQGCTRLRYIKMMATDVGNTGNTLRNWTSGVASTGVFVKNVAMSWEGRGFNGIPYGWTVVTATE